MMILTVTPNAALDLVLFVPRFQPETAMRAERTVLAVGGKGLDASVTLQCLGVPNYALTFSAGEVGNRLESLLKGYGIQYELVWLEGETRTSYVIVETELHRHSHLISPGYRVTPPDLKTFTECYVRLLGQADWVVMGGSLPPGAPPSCFKEWIEIAHEQWVPVLVDCPGEPAILAAQACPDILKINRSEFAQTFGGRAEPMEALLQNVRAAADQYNLPAIVITCGHEGILAVTSGKAWLASCPPQTAVNPAGSGDAVSASLAWQLAKGSEWENALRWAVAVSAASVLTEATSECQTPDVERLLGEVEIRSLK